MIDELFIFGAKYLYLVALGAAAVWFWQQPRARKRQMAIFGAVTLPLTYLAAKLAGHFYLNPRPFVTENITPLVPHAADNGFPSDHTLLIVAVAAVLWFFSRRAALLFGLLALFVGISRVYVGVHHPVDILGSFLVGIGVAAVVSTVLKPSASA